MAVAAQHASRRSRFALSDPGIGTTAVDVTITNGTFLAMAHRRRSRCSCSTGASRSSEGLAPFLWVGVIGTTLWIIVSGVTHFNAAQAFTFPPGAWTLNHGFFTGLGAALLIAVYDYWGYYNVCYLGGEIRDPARVIPRAILLSIAGVAAHLPDDEHLDPRRDAVAGSGEVALHRVRLHGSASGDQASARSSRS